MTSTKDAAGHPDVAEISDLVEGVLAPDRTASVRGHLGDCDLCADVHTALEEIRDALGTLPGPARMPADVAGRIDAALAAEALLSASDRHDSAAKHVSRETHRPGNRSSTERAGTRPGGRAASAPGRSEQAPAPTKRPARSSRRRILVLGAALTVVAVGIGVLWAQPFQDAQEAPTAAAATFSGRPLQQQVSGLLDDSAEISTSSSPRPRTLIRPDVEVPACVREGIPDEQAALAAREGSYQGRRAYLVVLPDRNSDSRVTAYVVDAACIGASDSGRTVEGEVLVRRSYPRTSN